MSRQPLRGRAMGVLAVTLTGLGILVAGTAASPALRIRGSTTLLPVVEHWVGAFERREAGAPVDLEAGGTTAALAALIASEADLALASRPAFSEELTRAEARGLELEQIEVVNDALSVIVHGDNPVTALTGDQLRRLFTGEIRTWSEVGGGERPVTTVVRNADSYTGSYFRRRILGDEPFAAASAVVANRREMVAAVAADSGAIGFAGLADAINSEERRRVKVVALDLDGAGPTYAIKRPLFFYAVRPRPPAVDRFVEFVLSAEGQALVVDSNFFPLENE